MHMLRHSWVLHRASINRYGKVYDNMLFREENGWDPMGLARNVDPATVDR